MYRNCIYRHISATRLQLIFTLQFIQILLQKYWVCASKFKQALFQLQLQDKHKCLQLKQLKICKLNELSVVNMAFDWVSHGSY